MTPLSPVTATPARRLALLEAQLARLPAPGCDRCAAWPDEAFITDASAEVRPLGRCRWDCPRRRDATAPCPDCARRAQATWPAELRCAACGREPRHTIRIAYDLQGEVWKRPPTPPAAAPEAAPDPAPPEASGASDTASAAPTIEGLVAAAQAALAPPGSGAGLGVSPSPVAPAPAALPESPAERRRRAVEAAEEARRAPRWGLLPNVPRGTSPRPDGLTRYRYR